MPPPSNICPPPPPGTIQQPVAGPPPRPLPIDTEPSPPSAGLSPELAAALAEASAASDATIPPPVTPPTPAAPDEPTAATDEPPLVDLNEIVCDWIAVNRKPEDIFSREALIAWAHANDFCTKEEVVKAIVENLIPKKS